MMMYEMIYEKVLTKLNDAIDQGEWATATYLAEIAADLNTGRDK